MNRPLIIICGKSGVGKTTVIKELCVQYKLKTVMSYSTRPQRCFNESSHIFVCDKDFELLKNKFLDFSFCNAKYCITFEQITQADILGLPPNACKDLCAKKNLIKRAIKVIYLKASDETRFLRMKQRGDSIKTINQRIMAEKKYFADFEKFADKIIYNYDFQYTLIEIEEYIKKLNCKIETKELFSGKANDYHIARPDYSKEIYNIKY